MKRENGETTKTDAALDKFSEWVKNGEVDTRDTPSSCYTNVILDIVNNRFTGQQKKNEKGRKKEEEEIGSTKIVRKITKMRERKEQERMGKGKRANSVVDIMKSGGINDISPDSKPGTDTKIGKQ